MKALIDRVRVDVSVALVAVLVLMTWPSEILGFLADLVGMP